jgi:hypothetical protein
MALRVEADRERGEPLAGPFSSAEGLRRFLADPPM